MIGDQNAALVGQQCFGIGQAKVTYGTGCFLIQNIGPGPLHGALKSVSHEAKKKLIVTVAYKFGEQPACYALEGSVAIAGAAVTWLRDNLQLVQNYSEIEHIARQDVSSGGLFFVPALQGLYAPYWDANATGTIIGVSQFSRKCHLVRATLEGVAFQANDILSMMQPNTAGIKVDGGMSSNDLLCQFLADISGSRIIRPTLTEATALGAAIVAGYTVRLWPELETQIRNYTAPVKEDLDLHGLFYGHEDDHHLGLNLLSEITRRLSFSQPEPVAKQVEPPPNNGMFEQTFDAFEPTLEEEARLGKIETWKMAVDRSRKWIRVEKQEQRKVNYKRLSALPLMMFVLLSFGTHILSVSTR